MEENKINNKEVKFITAGEKIASLLADSLVQCNARFRICRGLLSSEEEIKYSHNQQVVIRVNGVLDLINSQKELITNSRASIYHLSKKTDGPNDYSKLIDLLKALRFFEREFIKAMETRTRKDDFMITINLNNEQPNINRLTKNFHDMLEDLEYTYESIYRILLENGLLSPVVEQVSRRSKLNEL
jgi:hypothetical protein